MLRLFQKFNVVSVFLRITIACFLFFYSTEIYSIAPTSRFNNPKPALQKDFIAETIAIYSILYVASYGAKTPEDLKKIKSGLNRFERMFLKNGIPIGIEKVGYIKSQPGVVYCFFRVGKELKIVRVFSDGSENCIYPADVLAKEYFEGTMASAQIISRSSYDIIKIDENEIYDKPNHIYNKVLVSCCRSVSCLVGLTLDFVTLESVIKNPFSLGCFGIALIAITVAANRNSIREFFVFFKRKFLQKDFPQIPDEAGLFQSAIDEFMKENSKEILIGVETGWLSEIYGKRKVEKIIRQLQKKYNNRIKLFHSKKDEFARDVIKEMRENGTGFKNTILIGSDDILSSKRCKWLAESGVTCVAVDTQDVRRAKNKLNAKENFLIDITQILQSAINFYLGKDLNSSDYIEYIYETIDNVDFVKFKLKPQILRIDSLDRFYELELRRIQSA